MVMSGAYGPADEVRAWPASGRGAVAELISAGHVGLSEAGPRTLGRAHATHPPADLQIESSPLARDLEAES
jgi:hypothetical protein